MDNENDEKKSNDKNATSQPNTPTSKKSENNSTLIGIKRLMREAKELSRPSKFISAVPVNDDLYLWHFTIRGSEESPFEEGIYHGEIRVHPEYPFKPPEIRMFTPSGRFKTSEPICISSSNFHPELWQPSWGIRTIITALIGFMPSPADNAVGSVESSDFEKKRLASLSKLWECKICGVKNGSILLDVDSKEDSVHLNKEPLTSDIADADSVLTDSSSKTQQPIVTVEMMSSRSADLSKDRLNIVRSFISPENPHFATLHQNHTCNGTPPVNVGLVGFHDFSQLVRFSGSLSSLSQRNFKVIHGLSYSELSNLSNSNEKINHVDDPSIPPNRRETTNVRFTPFIRLIIWFSSLACIILGLFLISMAKL